MLRRLACAIGWHVPKLRSDLYGYYLGCAHCGYADVDAIRSRVPHDHMNADGTEQTPACGHLNCDPEGRGWKCLDCGTHLSNDRMVAIVKARRAFLNACPDCAGINGEHGLEHTRYGNGGGGNIPCPRSTARTAND